MFWDQSYNRLLPPAVLTYHVHWRAGELQHQLSGSKQRLQLKLMGQTKKQETVTDWSQREVSTECET